MKGFRLTLFLLSALWMGNAHAQLAALSYDRNAAATLIASADAATGVLGNQGAGSAACCEFGLGVNALDPFAQVVYAFGPDPADASAAWQMYPFDVTSGTALPAVTVSAVGSIVGAVYEQTPPRLLVLKVNAIDQLELHQVNTSSGALTLLNAGLANCCELLPNAVAFRSDSVYFAGRLVGSTSASLFSFPVDGSAVTSVALTSNLTALVTDRATDVMYGLQQTVVGSDLTLAFGSVDVATGNFTQISAAVVDCCAVAPDIAAISGGTFTAVVQQEGSSDYEFLSFDIGTGAATFSSAPIDTSRIVNGLFDATKGLQASTTTITSIAPSPSELGQAYTVNVSVTAAVPVTGSVTVSDGLGASCVFTLPATSCNLISTTSGNLTISAVYGGAPGLAGSGDTAAHTVNQATSVTTITSVVPAGSSTVGAAYTVNVSVTGFGLPTGTVVVDDGLGAMCNIVLPATSCMLTSTTAGATTISANYPGDANNTASADTLGYTIDRAATVTAITAITPAGSADVGSPYTVDVSVSGGFGVLTGSVAVNDGTGAMCTIVLPATNCILTSTTAGAKTISAVYSGDTNNLPSATTQAYTINLAASTTAITSIVPAASSIVGQAYTVNVTVTGFGPPTGAVAVDDGAGATCSITLPATSCMLTSTVVGAKTVTANYAGDASNLPSADTQAYQIDQETSTTTINSVLPNPGALGLPYAVNVTVTGFMPTGTVAVDDGAGASCNIVLPATSCSLTSTVAGAKTITATYPGDVNNTSSSDSAAQTIDLAPSTTTINSITPAASSVVGVAYTVDVSVTGFGVPVGTVAVDDGDGSMCNIVLPATTCMLTSTNAGPKTITATYPGDVNNLPSADTAAYTIDAAASTTTITSIAPAGLSMVGAAYTVNVSVAGFGVPTGNIAVDDGSGAMCTITLPATSCMLTSTTTGAKTINAAYAGDANNQPSGDTAAYQIDPAASTTTITAITPAGSSMVGQPYSVDVSVTGFGTPTGSVAVDDGAGAMCTITLPATSCMLTSTVVGPKTISANYAGDGNNLPSADTQAYQIDMATSTTTITSVVPSPAIVGQPYTVNVTVTGFGPPTGTMAVDDGAGAMCSIVLPATSCDLTSTTTGPKTITASYAGDVSNLPSSDTFAQGIDPAASTTTINSITPVGSSVVGVAYTVDVSVAGFGPPTGTVAVDDGTGATCNIVLPATSCMLTSTTAGAKTISASYPGDGNNLPSGDTAAYTIDRAASTTTITSIAPAGSSIVGVAYTVNVSVTGFGTPTGGIAVDDGSGAMCAITLPATSCMLTSTTTGAKTISAAYAGDSLNLPSGDTAAYQIDPAASITTITAITPAGSSMVGQPYSVDVTVTGFGTLTGTVAVDDGAGAACTITLPATSCMLTSTVVGAKTISANYSGDVNNLPSVDTQAYLIDQATSTTAITSVVKNPAIVGEPYTVSVTVTGFGPPIGTVAVDDGAGAMCSIVLPATSCDLISTSTGPKTITASYPGDVSNLPSSDTAAQGIDPAISVTTITAITPAGSSVVGVAYTVDVSVTGFGPPTGDVSVDDGTGAMCTITLPATSCMLTSTTAGAKTISANYPGDVNNTASSDTEAYMIDQAASTTTITSIAPPAASVVGVAYTVNVSVTGFGTLTGDIAVDDGTGATCTITLPATSCVLTSTTAGAKTITAAYAGDANNLASSDTEAYQIDRATSVTVVPSIVPNPPTAGMPYTVTVTVTGFGTPSGTVIVDDGNGGSCTITLPATSCTLTSTVAGALTLTASYSGDANNLPSSGTLVVNALQAATATALSAAPSPVIVGMPVVLTANVTQPGSAGVVLAGNVQFVEGAVTIPGCAAVPVVAGVALCSTSFTPAGERTLSANYLGDANNLPSAASLQLMVNRVPTTTTLTVLPTSTPINGLVSLSVLVEGGVPPLSGTVSITRNGFDIPECQNLTLTAGMTSCQFVALEANEFVLVATYSGDVDDDSSSGTANLSVFALSIPVGGPWPALLLALSLLLLAGRALPRD